jgi:shikimate dehydrogenase
MRLFGLIGYPLEHTFSPSYFAKKFEREGITDCDYKAFPLAALDELTSLLGKYPELEGLNVTKPYKQMVLNYLNSVEGKAYKIGAVNTIKIKFLDKGPHLKGFNTDIKAFEQSLEPFLSKEHQHALILGSGGASKAVLFVLEEFGITYKLISRNPGENRITYEELTKSHVRDCNLIINTTPIGTYPRTEEAPPIPYDAIEPAHFVYDLVYNPSETLLMQKAKAQGATVKNGQEMLELQAEESWRIWNDSSF